MLVIEAICTETNIDGKEGLQTSVFLFESNRPVYSCVLSCLAFE